MLDLLSLAGFFSLLVAYVFLPSLCAGFFEGGFVSVRAQPCCVRFPHLICSDGGDFPWRGDLSLGDFRISFALFRSGLPRSGGVRVCV